MSMQHVHPVNSHMTSTPPSWITHSIILLSKALKFVEFSAWAARTKHSSHDFWPFRENDIKLSINYGFTNDYFMESKTFWISSFRKRNLLLLHLQIQIITAWLHPERQQTDRLTKQDRPTADTEETKILFSKLQQQVRSLTCLHVAAKTKQVEYIPYLLVLVILTVHNFPTK